MRSLLVLFLFIFSATKLMALPDMEPDEYGHHTLHALLMCDTSNPKTGDLHLADITRIQESLKSITDACHLNLAVTVLKNKEITLEALKKWQHSSPDLTALAYGSVFIYYSGDKQRSVKSHEKYPTINLFKKGSKSPISVSVKKLFDELHLQRIWREFAFFDCYNEVKQVEDGHFHLSSPPFGIAEPVSRHAKKSKSAIKAKKDKKIQQLKEKNKALENIIKQLQENPQAHPDKVMSRGWEYLFWKPLGRVLAYSSSCRKPAYGIVQGSQKGGLFTLMLCDSLASVNTYPVYWHSILKEIEMRCFNAEWKDSKGPVRQQIIYDVAYMSPDSTVQPT